MSNPNGPIRITWTESGSYGEPYTSGQNRWTPFYYVVVKVGDKVLKGCGGSLRAAIGEVIMENKGLFGVEVAEFSDPDLAWRSVKEVK